MARSGPAPKPTKLKIIDGSRKDRINTREPLPVAVPPECPADVAADVREIWDYTLRELQHMGLAYACDRDALRAYCEAVVSHRKSCALLAKSPILIKSDYGSYVRNPALAIQRDTANTIRVFAQEFGLTPSARTRIESREPDSGDESPFSGIG